MGAGYVWWMFVYMFGMLFDIVHCGVLSLFVYYILLFCVVGW